MGISPATLVGGELSAEHPEVVARASERVSDYLARRAVRERDQGEAR